MSAFGLAVLSTEVTQRSNGAARRIESPIGVAETIGVADRLTDVLAPAVYGLYAVTLDLASMATSQTDDRVAQRLLDLMDRVDDAVCQLRRDVHTELTGLAELAGEPVTVSRRVRPCLGARLAAG
jgi:hypothetical protein